MDVSNFGKGGLTKPISLKDYRLENLPAGAPTLPAVFSLRNKIAKIKNQGQSLSCGSQGAAYYAALLNKLETGDDVELSARDIYSLIFQPEGGQYVTDCLKKICNSGVVLENKAVSYQNGNPPTEQFMRNRSDITPEAIEEGMTYWAKKYVTWDNTNIDLYKQAIMQGNGCLVASWGNNYCWQNAEILLPDNPQQMVWRHIIYIIGWDDSRKCFEFVNSWGENWGDSGFGWLPYDYVTKWYVTNPVTMVDVPNGTYSLMMKLRGLLLNLISLLTKKNNG